jgi:hypothetical protein
VHKGSGAFLGGDPGDALGALVLHRIEIVAPARVKGAHAVHHRIGALHGGAHRIVVTDVAKDRLHLTDGAIGAHEHGLVRAADRNPDAPALPGHALRDIPSDEPRAAVYGYQLGQWPDLRADDAP